MTARADDRAWIDGQKLFFAGDLCQESMDPVQLAEAIGMICNLRSFEAIVPDRHYLHRSGMVLVGDTAITTAAFLPQQGQTDDFSQCLIELPLSAGAGTCFTLERRDYQCHGGVQGLFLPGQAMKAVSSEPTATLGFNLDPARLTELLVHMSHHTLPPEQARLDLQHPHTIDLQDSRVAELWQWLQSILRMLGASSVILRDPKGALALSIEELIYRASLLMMMPDLIRFTPDTPRRESTSAWAVEAPGTLFPGFRIMPSPWQALS